MLNLQNLVLLSFGLLAKADVPTNCQVTDGFWAQWQFALGYQGNIDDVTSGIADENGNYWNLGDVQNKQYTFQFTEPSLVTDTATGVEGIITTIYAQGFQFEIYGQRWFAYYYFDNNAGTYDCAKTSVGWVQMGNTYARIQGTRLNADGSLSAPNPQPFTANDFLKEDLFNKQYTHDPKFISEINARADGIWKAKHNVQDERFTLREMMTLRTGGEVHRHGEPEGRNLKKVLKKAISKHATVMNELKQDGYGSIPANLDWRNYKGQNFVSPIDDQASCGSCYSFAAMGMMEARIRVMTNNTQQPIFSEQEIITCGQDKTYDQGCSGGWNILTAGKYMQEIGVVEEHCAPYDTVNYDNSPCPDVSSCSRWYSNEYQYLGGYYGAVTHDGGKAMMIALQDGPIGIGYAVYSDFGSYNGGVYVHTAVTSEWNPYEPVGHANVIVGYGICSGPGDALCGDETPAGTPYWIGKNSWGTSFGVDGYFLIIRGVDECGIESMPFEATPIPHL